MIPTDLKDIRIGVVGLGYVGLPLAVAFGRTNIPTMGLDVNSKKIAELQRHFDAMGELTTEELKETRLQYSDQPSVLKDCNFIIVAVPTPIDRANKPDLTLIQKASQTIGENLSKGTVVVFESTVYPGLTEEICVPIIESASQLTCGNDWKVGYSPERINPGDKEHTLDKIVKVVAGMDEDSLNLIAQVYETVCLAGVHRAPNIKTAEAAKVIENVQRDLNIALVNELALIFERIGIRTQDVLAAAGTKWNFHRYQPGLVGGHCIGVDPYYLTYRAEELGYHPQVILAGRRINDSMPHYVADLMIKGLIEAGKKIQGSKVLILGLTFKENVNDMRNSKAKEVIRSLKNYEIEVFGHDPLLSEDEMRSFGVTPVPQLDALDPMDGILLTVLHESFKSMDLSSFEKRMHSPGVLVDVKAFYSKHARPENPLIYKTL